MIEILTIGTPKIHNSTFNIVVIEQNIKYACFPFVFKFMISFINFFYFIVKLSDVKSY